MKSRRMFIASCTLYVLIPLVTVEACGPDFSSDVFVRTDRPGDMHAFAEGKLGILQTGYDSNDFAVAYRYLTGGKLSAQEEQAYAPPPQPVQDWTHLTPEQLRAAQDAQAKAEEESKPEYSWRQALAIYAPESQPAAESRVAPQPWMGSSLYYNPDYQNCPRPAFHMAALTLTSRAQTWGRQSEWLADWVKAQQAVFSNCSMKDRTMPASAPPGSPALLQADRAYQTAAAEFYAGNYDQARQSFQAIASDAESPWHIWGDFLAARAEVRAAFAAGPKTDPWSGNVASFDKPDMLRAQQMLEALLAHHDPGLSRSAIVQELNFVRLRTEPDQRFSEICAALAGPAPDGNFAQDLKDLSYVLEKKVALHSSPPLFAWMMALRGPKPDDGLLAWKQQPSLPWLVAALMRTPPTDPSAPELLKAAAGIRPNSPAWQTVMFHRIRLLTGMGRVDEARALLDGFLPAMRRQPADSALNAFLAERMAVARTFSEFLEFAPRTVLETSSEGWWYQRATCPSPPGQYSWLKEPCLASQPMEFDADAAAVLNRAPIEMLTEAAHSPELPANLREELAAAAWTRSVVLADTASAANLAPLLPRALHKTADNGVGFSAVLTILRNPGLRPYIEAGISHLNRPGSLDEFRDNWWCDDWSGQFTRNGKPAVPAPIPSFFTPQQAQAGAAQYEQVLALPCAPQFLGLQVLDYARAHPADRRLPEALALTVRATRYACLSWGRDEQQAGRENTSVSKAAFEMLHQRFPGNPWTARTKFYY
jgi:hypothetical protein